MDKTKVIKSYIKGMVKGYEELESDYKVFVIASLWDVLNFIDEMDGEE